MTSKVLKSKKLLLNGIFGVIKEKGYSIDDYKTWIRLTHYHESNLGSYDKTWSTPSIILDIRPRYMEPFATGILCVGIGTWSTKLTALIDFWRHEWVVSAKLGTQTQHYCSDSPIIDEKPFDHINEELLNETLKELIGAKQQLNPPPIWTQSLLIPKNADKKLTENVVKSEPTPRIRECHNIEVLTFKPPDIKLKIITDGFFSCRTLIHDLGLKLNSCAHLTELHLNRMGVITEKECLQKYELHSKQITDAIHKYSKIFGKDLEKFKDLKTPKRRVI